MIDLHTHAGQSDGSFAPADLVRAAVDLGLEALAIADHDTLAGYDAAHSAAVECRLERVCGIEAYHREHNAEQTALYASIAEKFHLIVKGGSDFHGANKPAISLGTGGRAICVCLQILEQMKNGRPGTTGVGRVN